MKYKLENVTDRPELWAHTDPVRPELDIEFKTSPGRGVFGLVGDDGSYKAFMCYAYTSAVPRSVEDLESLTDKNGRIVIPYTVWSHEKGAGRTIIQCVLDFVHLSRVADRVVTLSPITEMARRFHLRNDAREFRLNESTVNFEYKIQ